MMYNNIEFDTYFKNYPDANGYFGKYGGSYIPPELQNAMNEISEDLLMNFVVSAKNFRADLRRFRIWQDFQIRLVQEFSFM